MNRRDGSDGKAEDSGLKSSWVQCPAAKVKYKNIFSCFQLVALESMRLPLSIEHIDADTCDNKTMYAWFSLEHNVVQTQLKKGCLNNFHDCIIKAGSNSPAKILTCGPWMENI